MYSLRQIAKGLRWSVSQPSLVFRELNRLYHRHLYRRPYNQSGIDVMAADWDVLVILDACRYDMFQERSSLPGTLSKRTSRGSHTSEFIFGNFQGCTFPDTVYVTGSPILYRGLGDRYRTSFHDIINVWAQDGWDEEHNTVLPETMAKYGLRTAEQYPNKRIIVHFMQPHYPFIGFDLCETQTPDPRVLETDLWHRLMTADLDVSRAEIWEAYEANLDRALPHVETLQQSVTGKVVVTSDHGNMIGEQSTPIPVREWGHPPGVHTDELTTVPWLEYDDGPRREIAIGTPDASVGDEREIPDEVVTERLEQLGYAK